MRSQIIFGIIIFLVLGISAKKGCTTSIGWSGLTDLAIRSDIIATGTISFKDGNTVLITDRILKGQASKEVIIINYFRIRRLEAIFTENENVLLFMKSIDANSACLTSDYLAKWPRNYISEHSNILDRASIESIAGLVNEILIIDSKTDIKTRIFILRHWLQSSDSLLNLVALQYVLSSHFWPEGLLPDYKKGITRHNFRKQLSGYAFKLIQSDSPSVQAKSIELLRYADPEQALPILISRITDTNNLVRNSTRNVLSGFEIGLQVGEGFDYTLHDTPEKLLSVQRKWQEWYEANYSK